MTAAGSPERNVPMKMYLISDNVDTRTGLRLSGVDGCLVHSELELKSALTSVSETPGVGILLITEKLAADYPDIISAFASSHKTPIIAQIPDRHGTTRATDYLTAFAGEALGVNR